MATLKQLRRIERSIKKLERKQKSPKFLRQQKLQREVDAAQKKLEALRKKV